MNRNNIWIHITIAAVVITFAAVFGQINRWERSLTIGDVRVDTTSAKKPSKAHDPEVDVLVRFKPGVSFDRIRQIAARNNDRLDDEIEAVNGLVSLDDMDDANAASVAAQYAAMTDLVSYAEVNGQVSFDDPETSSKNDLLDRGGINATPNDPDFDQQWALNNTGQDGGKSGADISSLEAWKKTRGSEDVVVAVLDSGVDYEHVDLRTNIWERPDSVPAYYDDELGEFNDEHGYNGTDQMSDPMDDNGHGTHCAGIIGAEGDNDEGIAGINWNVQIMPLKFLGRGGFGTTADAIKAINYAIDRKKAGVNLRVINASWGSTQNSKALEDAIRAAGDAGILFVAAAGNNGTDNDKRAHYPSNYDLPNVISVAATDRADALTSFSNFGVKTVHIAAPGRDIESTWLGNAYRDASGTSMAAPQVAGVAALILSAEPNLTVAQLRDRILKSVDKLPNLAGKVSSGGRLNAAKALER
ncbi:MAG: S8 family peptidase [Acidobacteriota bacterium]